MRESRDGWEPHLASGVGSAGVPSEGMGLAGEYGSGSTDDDDGGGGGEERGGGRGREDKIVQATGP